MKILTLLLAMVLFSSCATRNFGLFQRTSQFQVNEDGSVLSLVAGGRAYLFEVEPKFIKFLKSNPDFNIELNFINLRFVENEVIFGKITGELEAVVDMETLSTEQMVLLQRNGFYARYNSIFAYNREIVGEVLVKPAQFDDELTVKGGYEISSINQPIKISKTPEINRDSDEPSNAFESILEAIATIPIVIMYYILTIFD